jgi:hypothetical protein
VAREGSAADATRVSTFDDGVRGFMNFMDSGPSIPLTLAIALLLAPVLGLIHDLGHATAALVLLPGRVLVRVGGPQPLGAVDVGRMNVSFHPLVLPWRFDAVCSYEADSASRAETIAIALAGPAASLVAGVFALNALEHAGSGPLHDVLKVATLLSLGSVVVCLLPFTLTDSQGTRLRTDGATAIDALR